MKLFLTATSERGKPVTKSGNEYIIIDLTVDREPVGQIELYLTNDTGEGCLHNWDDENQPDAICKTCGYCKSNDYEEDEWLIKYKRNPDDENEDWQIIAQGNLPPVGYKPKTQRCFAYKGFDCNCDRCNLKTAIEPREGICHCGYPCVYGTDYCERHQTP